MTRARQKYCWTVTVKDPLFILEVVTKFILYFLDLCTQIFPPKFENKQTYDLLPPLCDAFACDAFATV
jgi:hypothetical protein